MSREELTYPVATHRFEHDSDSPETKKVSIYGWNVDSLSKVKVAVDSGGNLSLSSLVPEEYDYIAMTYVATGNGAGEIETVVYKLGGSGGTTQATLTLAYDASHRLISVAKS
jgi:hypothetical protein